MCTYPCFILFAAALAASPVARADRITIGKFRYEDVYISESVHLYYISHPETGKTSSILKDDPDLGDVAISADEEHRDELYARYLETRARNRPGTVGADRPVEIVSYSSSGDETDRIDKTSPIRFHTHSSVPLLEFHGTPRAHRAPIAPPQSDGSFGANQAGFGSVGGMGSGGTQRGAAGGRGGRGGMSQGRSAGFTNISELFGTIDDASVGEAPNPITGLR